MVWKTSVEAKLYLNADEFLDYKILENDIFKISNYIFTVFSKTYYVNIRCLLVIIIRSINYASNGGIYLDISHQKNCTILKNRNNGFLNKTLFYK